MGTVHDFNECLERSHEQAEAAWWGEVYRKAFGSRIVCMHSVRNDGWAQRGGIDRQILLDCGRMITVDEKVRGRDYADIALEYKHEFRDGKTISGWVKKPLACDYIAYAFVPSQRCYLLPFLNLRKAWHEHARDWIKKYGDIRAQNKSYVSVCCPVPTDVLLDALRDTLVVEWGAAA